MIVHHNTATARNTRQEANSQRNVPYYPHKTRVHITVQEERATSTLFHGTVRPNVAQQQQKWRTNSIQWLTFCALYVNLS